MKNGLEVWAPAIEGMAREGAETPRRPGHRRRECGRRLAGQWQLRWRLPGSERDCPAADLALLDPDGFTDKSR